MIVVRLVRDAIISVPLNRMETMKMLARGFCKAAYTRPRRKDDPRRIPFHLGPAFDVIVIGLCAVLAVVYFTA